MSRIGRLQREGGEADHPSDMLPRTYQLPSINLWSAPARADSGATIVATLPRGTAVEILDELPGGWMRVRANLAGRDLEGWIHRTFLSRGW